MQSELFILFWDGERYSTLDLNIRKYFFNRNQNRHQQSRDKRLIGSKKQKKKKLPHQTLSSLSGIEGYVALLP